jgi:hypothetical protein
MPQNNSTHATKRSFALLIDYSRGKMLILASARRID